MRAARVADICKRVGLRVAPAPSGCSTDPHVAASRWRVAWRYLIAVFVLFALATAQAQAQPAPGIVVTSPHVWQPGGSAPPYGVQVLPGSGSIVELSFTNTASVDVPWHRPRLLVRDTFVDFRTHYQFLASSDTRCGSWAAEPPTPPNSNQAYTLDVGPLPAGATLVCRWEVRRSVSGGDDFVLRVPGLDGSLVHFGAINDLDVSTEQLTPVTAGVSRSVLFRLTVRNRGPVDLLDTPRFGLCSSPSPLAPVYRPEGPEPCERARIFCLPEAPLLAITAGAVPAGESRSCTFALQYREPVRQIGQFVVPSYPQGPSYTSSSGYIFDPNPSNNQAGPLLTVGAAEISLFGDVESRITLLLMLGMLLVATSGHRLRSAG